MSNLLVEPSALTNPHGLPTLALGITGQPLKHSDEMKTGREHVAPSLINDSIQRESTGDCVLPVGLFAPSVYLDPYFFIASHEKQNEKLD